jgi:SAM-dependent methyltransferase
MTFKIDWHKRYLTQARWTHQLREHLYKKHSLGEDSRILEVGSGTGVITHELSDRFPSSATGVDIDFDATFQATRYATNSRFVVADGENLPFPNSCFELTVSHFLFLWVDDPLAVLSEMKRVTRQGGATMALAEPDYGGRIDYPPALGKLAGYQTQALIGQGANPYIGRQLAGLFHLAGLVDVETGLLGGHWSYPADSQEIASEWEVLRSDLGEILSAREMYDFKELDETAWKSGSRILFVPTFYAIGKVA